MLTLKPVMPEFKISTTDLKVVYTESDGVKVEVGAIPLKNPQSIDWDKCVNIEICFPLVAEAKCVTVLSMRIIIMVIILMFLIKKNFII